MSVHVIISLRTHSVTTAPRPARVLGGRHGCLGMSDNSSVVDHRQCRFTVSGGEFELAGPPTALRSLSDLLRRRTDRVEVPISGGTVVQEVTTGPLLVSLPGAAVLSLSGGREHLDIVWDALVGVADDAQTAEDRSVNRHQHIEYFPGDEHRSPDSIPLIILADWPDTPAQATY